MGDKKSASDRLKELIGHDPVKSPTVTSQLLKEALQEHNEERHKAAKARAKEVLAKAVQIQVDFEKQRAEFRKKEQQFDKELGGLLGQLEAHQRGEAPKEETEAETPDAM